MSSFVDGQGHYVQFGDPWQDEDGRWYSPGDSFRDGRGNWISWGDSFQDTSGVWRNWGEPFIDYSGHYAYPPHKQDYSYLNALILDDDDDDDYDHSDYDNDTPSYSSDYSSDSDDSEYSSWEYRNKLIDDLAKAYFESEEEQKQTSQSHSSGSINSSDLKSRIVIILLIFLLPISIVTVLRETRTVTIYQVTSDTYYWRYGSFLIGDVKEHIASETELVVINGKWYKLRGKLVRIHPVSSSDNFDYGKALKKVITMTYFRYRFSDYYAHISY